MTALRMERRARVLGREGFVMPAVVFVFVIVSVLAVVTLRLASDEQRASRALRESGTALYAAEAGVHLVWATQADSGGTVADSAVASLAGGDSVDLGWRTLPDGAGYRAVIHRVDDGGQELYLLVIESRGAGPLGGHHAVSFALTKISSAVSVPGAFVGQGIFDVGSGGGVVVDGNDNVPPGWGGVCDPPGPAVPGIRMRDTTKLNETGAPSLLGTPPLDEDPAWGTPAFDSLWNDLVTLADKVYPPSASSTILNNIGPVVTGGVCDASVLDNWGAPTDPTHPCFDYFPIIHVENARVFGPGRSGQGILLVDCTAAGQCDLELENGFTFYGLILVKGEFELETGAAGTFPSHVYGAVIADNYGLPTKTSKIWTGSTVRYSSCVLQRIGAGSGSLGPLVSRAWGELLR